MAPVPQNWRKKVAGALPWYLLVFVLAWIPLFHQLGEPVLNHWDESRRAVNALEMLQNGNLIVTHYDGEPEMWGTKPPLMIWMQTLSFALVGPGELALRIPSALAGLALAWLILWFCKRQSGSYLPGIAASLLLFTSPFLISVHGARTGDFESLLVLFSTASVLFLFLAIEPGDRRVQNRYMLWFFIAFTLAALTKGIAPFMLVPGMGLYLLFTGNLLRWLRSGRFWIGLGILAGLFGGYYLLRELLNPGYLRAVVENEMTGRYFDTLEQNQAPFGYYIKGMYRDRFRLGFFLLPVAILAGYASGEGRWKRFIHLVVLVAGIYLLVISTSKTKLAWYDMPVYPLLVVLAGLFFHFLFTAFRAGGSPLRSALGRRLLPPVVLISFFAAPFHDTWKKVNTGSAFRQDETYALSHYLRDLAEGSVSGPQDSLNIVLEGDPQQYLFYMKRIASGGTDVQVTGPEEAMYHTPYVVHSQEAINELQARGRLQLDTLSGGVYSALLLPDPTSGQ